MPKFYTFFLILALFAFFAAGCDLFFNEQQAREKVLNQEPSFERVLGEKTAIDKQIDELNRLTRQKKEVMQTKIDTLKREYASEKRRVDAQIEQLRLELEKYINEVRLEAESLAAKLKAKKRILANINSSIKEASRLLSDGQAAQLDAEERGSWQDRLDELESQKTDIISDIENLERELSHERTKLKLLKH